MNFQEGEYVDIHVYRARVVRHVGDDLVVMYHGRERRIPLVPIDDDAANVVRVTRVLDDVPALPDEMDDLAAQVKRVREELIAEEARLLDARALVNPQKKRLLDDAARRLRVLADSIDEGAGR